MPVTLRLFRRLGGMKWLNLVALFGIGAAAGCGNAADREAPTAESASPAAPHQRSEAPERSAPTSASQSREGAGPPPAAWVQRRVAQAEERLGESEAGRVLAQAIDAHGGLRRWLEAGNVSFFFDYRSLTDASRRMNTHQRVDLWSSRAVHESRQGEVRFGWDGQAAWIEPNANAFPLPARFWALTPYYFVAMPFVLADPGANFELLPDEELDGQRHRVVKVTYDAGIGDSPDDYYIVYLNADSHRVAGLRYIVSYPGFFEPGEHSPEKLMRYTDVRSVQGLLVAHRYDTYAWSEAGVGAKVTEIEAGEFVFGAPLSDEVFAAPEGAQVSPMR